jgi:predicted outer membrane protein
MDNFQKNDYFVKKIETYDKDIMIKDHNSINSNLEEINYLIKSPKHEQNPSKSSKKNSKKTDEKFQISFKKEFKDQAVFLKKLAYNCVNKLSISHVRNRSMNLLISRQLSKSKFNSKNSRNTSPDQIKKNEKSEVEKSYRSSKSSLVDNQQKLIKNNVEIM